MPSHFVSWFRNYFENRTQFVKVGNIKSSLKSVPSAVPQGSVLGPFLFSMLAGSFVPSINDCKVVKYADDFTICVPLLRDSNNRHIYECHSHFLEWASSCDLIVNERKCKMMCIQKRLFCSPVPLPNVTLVSDLKLLGVTSDSKLRWTNILTML